MEVSHKKSVLITGGSSGLGFALSKIFAKNNFDIYWVSLYEEEMDSAKKMLQEEFPNIKIEYKQKDLSDINAAVEIHQWMKRKNKKIDILINNAGFGTYGLIQKIDIEKELKMIQLNVLNLYQMTRLFLDDMIAYDSGTIINISSNSSFQPVPNMSTYAATKAFVTNLSRSISEELKYKNSKVSLITVCPSAIKDTNFKKEAKMEKVKTFSGLATTTVEEVAKDIWNGYQSKKAFIVTGRKMRLLYAIRNLIPFRIQQYMIRKETALING